MQFEALYYADRLKIVNPSGDVAVCTLWSKVESAHKILEEAGVGVAPGIDFGSNAEGFIRFSYTNSMENILAGLDRIELYLKRRFGT